MHHIRDYMLYHRSLLLTYYHWDNCFSRRLLHDEVFSYSTIFFLGRLINHVTLLIYSISSLFKLRFGSGEWLTMHSTGIRTTSICFL